MPRFGGFLRDDPSFLSKSARLIENYGRTSTVIPGLESRRPLDGVDTDDSVEVDQHQGLSVLSGFLPVCDQVSRQRSSYSSSSARSWATSAAICASVIGIRPRCC